MKKQLSRYPGLRNRPSCNQAGSPEEVEGQAEDANWTLIALDAAELVGEHLVAFPKAQHWGGWQGYEDGTVRCPSDWAASRPAEATPAPWSRIRERLQVVAPSGRRSEEAGRAAPPSRTRATLWLLITVGTARVPHSCRCTCEQSFLSTKR